MQKHALVVHELSITFQGATIARLYIFYNHTICNARTFSSYSLKFAIETLDSI